MTNKAPSNNMFCTKSEIINKLKKPQTFFIDISAKQELIEETCVITKEKHKAYNIFISLPIHFWHDEDIPEKYLKSATIFWKNNFLHKKFNPQLEALKFGFKNNIRKEHLSALEKLYSKQCILLNEIKNTNDKKYLDILSFNINNVCKQISYLESLPLFLYPEEQSKQIYKKLNNFVKNNKFNGYSIEK